jgi:hypothetical protein
MARYFKRFRLSRQSQKLSIMSERAHRHPTFTLTVLSIVSHHRELAEKPHTLNIGQHGEEKAVGKKNQRISTPTYQQFCTRKEMKLSQKLKENCHTTPRERGEWRPIYRKARLFLYA